MWDERYSEPGFAFGTEPNDFLVASQHFIPPRADILCLAEGEGRNAVYLARRGHRPVAVDSSEVGLTKAVELARRHAVSIQVEVADLADYCIAPLSYDAIVSIFCHLPSAARRHLHRQVFKGLRPDGVFIMEGYATRQLEFATGGPKDPELLMDLATVTRELQPLTLRHAMEIERSVYEGRYHSGPGAVIQIIGVKE